MPWLQLSILFLLLNRWNLALGEARRRAHVLHFDEQLRKAPRGCGILWCSCSRSAVEHIPAHITVCQPGSPGTETLVSPALGQPSRVTQGCTSARGGNWQAPGSCRAADPGSRMLLWLGKFAKRSHQHPLPLTQPNTNGALLIHICALGEFDPLLDKWNKLLSWGAWTDGNKYTK